MDRTKISSLFSRRKMKYVKKVYKNFCETISLHGFLEVYKAESKLWLIFWMSVVTWSIIVTGHQLNQAVDHYNNQDTLILIQPASKSQMFSMFWTLIGSAPCTLITCWTQSVVHNGLFGNKKFFLCFTEFANSGLLFSSSFAVLHHLSTATSNSASGLADNPDCAVGLPVLSFPCEAAT